MMAQSDLYPVESLKRVADVIKSESDSDLKPEKKAKNTRNVSCGIFIFS